MPLRPAESFACRLEAEGSPFAIYNCFHFVSSGSASCDDDSWFAAETEEDKVITEIE